MVTRGKSGGKEAFGELERLLGHTFKDHADLALALTHSSHQKGTQGEQHYERLEFLGDRVLGLCIADALYQSFPHALEGGLALRLNSLVNGKVLAEIADGLELHKYIRTGEDIKNVTGKRMQSVRADVMEATIGAVYCDGGLEAARKLITRLWGNRINDSVSVRQDPKTALQEWAHARRLETPKYREKGRSGPDHDPVFTVEAKVQGMLASEGAGRSKRIAEQDAARSFLIREGVWSADD